MDEVLHYVDEFIDYMDENIDYKHELLDKNWMQFSTPWMKFSDRVLAEYLGDVTAGGAVAITKWRWKRILHARRWSRGCGRGVFALL